MERRFVRIFANTVIAIAIVAGGVVVAKKLIASKQDPRQKETPDLGLLVETEPTVMATHQLLVTGQGTVMPSQTVNLRPQVAGEVVWVNDAVVLGGRVAAGDELFRIESRDYELTVIERKTALEQAKAQLALEQGHKEVAEQEWEIFEESAAELLGPEVLSNRNLATREPQILSATKNIEAASTRVRRAKLDLARTSVSSPINGVVQSEGLEVGQLVSNQSVAVTLVGSDVYWVQVSVPVDRLDWIDVPGLHGQKGSAARAILDLGARKVSWHGEVIRLLPELDPAGRMARLLVAIKEPLDGGDLPLLLGSFVMVEIDAKQPLEAVEIPRSLVHSGDKVYLYSPDGTLEIRDVEAGWRRDETLLITKGLKGGESIVTSRIGSPLPNMKLRLPEQPEEKSVESTALEGPLAPTEPTQPEPKPASEASPPATPETLQPLPATGLPEAVLQVPEPEEPEVVETKTETDAGAKQ